MAGSKQFESQPENAEQYLAVGAYKQKEVLSIPEMAAYTIVANAIFNLDEAITKSWPHKLLAERANNLFV